MATIKGRWLFNEELTITKDITQDVYFTSDHDTNGITKWRRMRIQCTENELRVDWFFSEDDKGYTTEESNFSIYRFQPDNTAAFDGWNWYDSSRLITFTEEQTVSDEFYAWFTANAKPGVTDLTATAWNIPAGWSAKAWYGKFELDFVLIGDLLRGLNIGYEGEYQNTPDADTVTLTAKSNTISYVDQFNLGDNIDNTQGFTISIRGGTDATNALLITWLYDNGELVSGGEEETPNEGETTSNGISIHYNGSILATITEGQSITLHTKGLKAKTDIVIKNNPASSGDDDMQTLTVINSNNPSETASFTMPSGYTFGQFVGSEYDTSSGAFTISAETEKVDYRDYRLTGSDGRAFGDTYARGTFYYEGAAVYTLSGTWLFNEILTMPSANINEGTLDATFGNSVNANKVQITTDAFYIDDNGKFDIYTTTRGWFSSEWRVLIFNSTQTVSEEFYEWFTANATFQFTIDGTAYYAKAGMTWGEWVADTTLNTDGYDVQDDRIINHPNNGVHTSYGVLLNDSSAHVSPADPIIVGYSYLYGMGN